MMRRRLRLVAAIVLAIVLCAGLGPTLAMPRTTLAAPRATLAARGPDAPLRPVLLVHGLGGDASAWSGAPLPAMLQRAGYVPGKTLFIVDYGPDNNGDYTIIYERYLMPAIDEAKAASGADQVDIVAFSMGGLVSRYYAQSPAYRGDVHTLVLLASPTRGSFAASLVRGWYETDVQYHWPHDFHDRPEHAYVRQRLPAYAELAHQQQLGSRGRLFNRTRALLDWTRAADPEFFDDAIIGRQFPILADVTPAGVPTPAAGLTGSFYELLTAQTAMALTERPPLQTWAPFLPLTVSYIGDMLLDEDTVLGPILWLMRNLGLEAGSDAINRMVDDFSPAGSTVRVLTNHFLFDWNESLAASRGVTARRPDSPFRGVRQVIVAGSMLNLWAPVRHGTGPNDGVVEVAATVLPPERDDRFRLFSGPLLHHLQMKNSNPVAAYILAALQDEFQPTATWSPPPPGLLRRWFRKHEPVTRSARLLAGYWEPTYFDIQPPTDGGSGTLNLSVTLPDRTARTGAIAAWLHLERRDGTWETRDLLYPGTIERQATVRLPGFGADAVRILVGVRRQLPPGDIAALAMDGAHALPVNVTAAFTADGSEITPPPATPVHAPAPAPPPPLLGPRPGTVGDAGDSTEAAEAGAAAATEPTPADAGSSHAADVPLITVERTNRLTTSWKEDITAHASWSWDFGDGTVIEDPDPAHVRSTVQHSFAAPGQYTVTATATSNNGETIRRQTFPVTVTAPGETHAFTAESIQPLQVAFTLSGPKAWLVGKTAPFTATADVAAPLHGEVTDIRFDPGEEFLVLWKRPNHFEVLAAVRIDVTYRWPEGGTFKLRNTYVRRQLVEVMATGLSR